MTPNQPPRPPTLARIARDGYGLRACCNSCQASEPLDLENLISRFGPDFIAVDLNDRLVCRQCGARNAAIQLVPVTTGGVQERGGRLGRKSARFAGLTRRL